MKLFLIFCILLLTTTTFTAHPPLLASVEITTSTSPPVEKGKAKKNKAKKKKHYKKKRFKKPNHITKTNTKAARVRLTVVTAIICGVTLILILLVWVLPLNIFFTWAIIGGIVATASFLVSLAMIIITIIFNIVDYSKDNKTRKSIKRPEEELRAEVSNLDDEKVAQYLVLNEQLTAAIISQRIAQNLTKDKNQTPEERKKAKQDVINFRQDIRATQQKLTLLRRENKAKKLGRKQGE